MTDTYVSVADHPNSDLIQELWEDGLRAAAILEELANRGLPSIKKANLARYGQRYWTDKALTRLQVDDFSLDELGETISTIQEHGTIKKVSIVSKSFPGWEKIDGENVQVEKTSTSQTIEIVPEGPAFDVQVGPFNVVPPEQTVSAKPDGWKLLVDFPDKQTGYFRDPETDEVLPIHDEAALNVAYQILVDLEASEGVDVVVNQGDDLDFAEFTTHRSTPAYKGLLNRNLNRHATDLAMQREMVPDAEIVQLFGNHEARLEKFITDRAPELLGISKAGERTPVLSIPHLCGYDELGITYEEVYPHGVYWANDFLKFHHGTITSNVPGGAAGQTLGSSNGVSVVFGHDHFQSVAQNTVYGPEGPRSIFAASGGCLCRVDGAVPSSKGGIKPSGAYKSRETWQQGILVIYFEPDGLKRSVVEPVLINSGTAMFRGKLYQSNVDVNGQPYDSRSGQNL